MSRRGSWRRPWVAFVASCVGADIGLGLLTRSLPSFPEMVVWLVWSVSWWLVVLGLAGLAATARRSATRWLASTAGVGLVAGWLTSWWTREALGSLLDVEMLRFAARNARMTGLHLLQTEPLELTLFAASIAVVAILWILVVSRFSWSDHDRSAWRWTVIACGLVAIVGVTWERDRQLNAAVPSRASWTAHPGPAFAASVWRINSSETLADCLDGDDLQSLVPVLPVEIPEPRLSVLLVAVESLRADVPGTVHQGRSVMPTLDQLAADGVVFSNLWAASTHSDYSDVSALTGTYPLRSTRHHYYRRTDSWPRVLPWNLLGPAGYRTALISAQNESWGGMDAVLDSSDLDLFWDARTAAAEGVATRAAVGDEAFREAVESGLRAGKVDDHWVTERALAWLEASEGAEEPFLLALNFQSSHFPYELDHEAPRPFEPWALDFQASFTWYPPEATDTVRNAYFNALAYVDDQLQRLMAELEELDLADRTIVVVYGENGEAFHENGLVTHASHPYEPALRVPMVMRAPGLAASRTTVPGSLVDLVPTVLGRLGISPSPAHQGVDLLAPGALDRRALYFHNENPITRADGVVVDGRWKLWRDREIDRLFLFDLVSDPAETTDLSRTEPELTGRLAGLVDDFRCRQLVYHQNPLLHSRAYPPSTPQPTW